MGWALVIALFASQLWIFRTFFVDDAFITFRYVQQFVAGNGLVYNIGERVEGYSNFLWVMLLSPPYALGADLVMTARVLSIMLSVGTLILVSYLARRSSYLILAPIMLAAAGPFGAWTMGGLETSLFAFLLTASTIAFIREEERGYGWTSGLLFVWFAGSGSTRRRDLLRLSRYVPCPANPIVRSVRVRRNQRA